MLEPPHTYPNRIVERNSFMKDTWLYHRGDIYLVDLGKPIGSVQGGCRPAVVIQNDIGNQYGPTLIVAPITSRIWKKAEQPTHCRLDKMECLSDSSMVLLEQITTIDKSLIRKYLGKFDKSQMNKIDYCIKISLGLCKIARAEIFTEGKL